VLRLKAGTAVVVPAEDTVVATPYGQVTIGANSVVLLILSGSGLSVFDLDDTKHGAVRIRSGERSIVLSPGMHATLTTERNFADANPAQCVAHRKLTASRTGSSLQVF